MLTNLCTGCSACLNICPNNVITMDYSKEGFYCPTIDYQNCTNCGLCDKTCPQLNEIKRNNSAIKCFAAICSDDIRVNSASGGVFASYATSFIENGGFVCGASFSKNYKKVEHIIINKIEDLILLQNSKYVQSYIGSSLKKIKDLLEKGHKVLFGGTPCQVAGLLKYLDKDYKNLLTVDIVCYGIPSPLVWEKFLDEKCNRDKIKKVSFRNKTLGWHNSYKFELKSSSQNFSEDISENLYFRAFFDNLIVNKACYDCKYTNLQRVGDITLGDFWGIENYDKSLDDNKGTSLILLNTPKGIKFFNDNKSLLKICKEVPLEIATRYNPRLVKSCVKNLDSKIFIANLNSKNIIQNIKQELCPKYEGIIRNFWFIQNFGATLSAYAIQQYFEQRGLKYYLLKIAESNGFVKEFESKYLKTTHIVNSYQKFIELNDSTDNFVLGTDQILRDEFVAADFFNAMFTYTKFSKRRFVFSGSFGTNNINNISKLEKFVYKKFISRFDAISTRELSGINICKKEFNINANRIIDPVFLIDKNKWLEMAPDTQNKYKNKLVYYILNSPEREELNKVIGILSQKYNCQSIEIINGKTPVEEFISAVKDSKYFLTNSFHGMCFALIFNKPVICIKEKSLAPERLEHIAQLFDIKDLFVDNYKEILQKTNLWTSYDEKYIESIIDTERNIAEEWFNKNILNAKRNYIKAFCAELNFILYKKLQNIVYKFKPIYRKYKLLNAIDTKKRIALWGASLFLEDFLKKNKIKTNNIIGIIDKNPAKWGQILEGYKIYRPEDINILNPDNILITILNNSKPRELEIKQYLKENYKKNVKIILID